MPPEGLVATMKSLKLFGVAQAFSELAGQQSPAFQKAQPLLDDLLKAEVTEREVRSINYQMKVARFPAYRDLAGFKFEESAVDANLVGHDYDKPQLLGMGRRVRGSENDHRASRPGHAPLPYRRDRK